METAFNPFVMRLRQGASLICKYLLSEHRKPFLFILLQTQATGAPTTASRKGPGPRRLFSPKPTKWMKPLGKVATWNGPMMRCPVYGEFVVSRFYMDTIRETRIRLLRIRMLLHGQLVGQHIGSSEFGHPI